MFWPAPGSDIEDLITTISPQRHSRHLITEGEALILRTSDHKTRVKVMIALPSGDTKHFTIGFRNVMGEESSLEVHDIKANLKTLAAGEDVGVQVSHDTWLKLRARINGVYTDVFSISVYDAKKATEQDAAAARQQDNL